MGILKKISKAAEKAERGYGKMKEDAAGAKRVGGKILDWAIPPPKKKKASGGSRTPKSSGKSEMVKIGRCKVKRDDLDKYLYGRKRKG